MGTPRILISATASGVGKTTVCCGLLRALTRRGLRVRAFKCGPDYIDPAFHRAVIGVPSRNLDLFLSGEEHVRGLVAQAARAADVTLVEGAMGYYDGIAQSTAASAHDIARATQTPVVLVVDARGRALSAAAEVAGFARFRQPSMVAGVIFNRATAGYYPQLKAVVERECGVPALGYVPHVEDAELESRHLGLVDAAEVAGLQARLDVLADAVDNTVDVDALLRVAATARPLPEPPAPCEPALPTPPATGGATPVVAVARDEAFSFYYDEALELLERLGARIATFSPLHDAALPTGACGLYLGGGYPELHARVLGDNAPMRRCVREAVLLGMPTIAECGGFLYLHRELVDNDGAAWPMAGVLRARAFPRGRLVRFGYATLTARSDGLLAREGESLPAHEFHYWESTDPGSAFRAHKPQSARAWDCGISTPTLYAGFPHLYLPGRPEAARRFVEACRAYAGRKGA